MKRIMSFVDDNESVNTQFPPHDEVDCDDNEVEFTLPVHEVEPKETIHISRLRRHRNLRRGGGKKGGGQISDWGYNYLGINDLKNTYGLSGNGVTVSVLDTGVFANHEDLQVRTGKDFTGSMVGWNDIQGHGTHCAGIICARDNNTGVIGVAHNATLYAVKVLGDSGTGSIPSIVSGVNWAVANGTNVISMSLGGDGPIDPRLRAAIDNAIANGVIVVVAAGNSGPYEDTTGAPGVYKPCVTVGAIDVNSRIAQFSSRGLSVDVVAPGVDINSTYPGNRYTKLSGTSMATPYVAGIACLYVEYCKRQSIEFSQANFEKLIKETANDLGAAGFDTSYGSGAIDPAAIFAKLEGDNDIHTSEVGGGGESPHAPPVAPSPLPPHTPHLGGKGSSIRIISVGGNEMILHGVQCVEFMD